MKKTTDQDAHPSANAIWTKSTSPTARETQLSPPRAGARSGGRSPHRENDNNASQVHIRITESGEICAWGLDQKGEEQIFSLTGNLDLINICKAMSYNLCG